MLIPLQKRPWTRFTTIYTIASPIRIVSSICADSSDPQIRYGAGVNVTFYVLGRPRVRIKDGLAHIQHRLYLSKAIDRIVSESRSPGRRT